MHRLAFVVTSGMTARWLMRGQPAFLAAQGFDVHLIASPGVDLDEAAAREGVEAHGVPMRRGLAPLSDLVALARLTRTFRRLAPTVVNAGTPKAGLLGMLAARRARVPVRIYTLRGLRLETTRGWQRRLLATTERLASGAAHRTISVSDSLRRRYLELGLATEAETAVLGAGSSNGIDCDRFRPRPADEGQPAELRQRLGLARETPVVGFVGRLTRDKGVGDLVRAFRERLAPAHPRCRLLLVGEEERGDPLAGEVRRAIADDPRVVQVGRVEDPAPYYALMEVVAFPSRREGFPNVPLEAAASGVPVVGYRVTGTVDAVDDGATGTLVQAGDLPALADALGTYLADGKLRRSHGEAARKRAREKFDRRLVWQAWLDEYRRLLAAAGVG